MWRRFSVIDIPEWSDTWLWVVAGRTLHVPRSHHLHLLEDAEDEHHVRAEAEEVAEGPLVEGAQPLGACEREGGVDAARVAPRRRVVQPRARHIDRVDARDRHGG